MPSIKQALEQAQRRLQGKTDSPLLECQLLLAHALGVDRAWLYAHTDDMVEPSAITTFQDTLTRREKGEPIAYITGIREFWSLPFKVTTDTLIPRPETEHLVEYILGIEALPEIVRVLDFGTGSGVIAISLAHEKPEWVMTAVDISEKAIAVAKQNAQLNDVTTIRFLPGDGFLPVSDERFDIIVSNPPYVPENDPHLKQGDVRFEPQQALRSGPDGLDCIRYLAHQARNHLSPQGHLVLEHGYDQGEAVRSLLQQKGYTDINTVRDLNQQERLTSAIWDPQHG
jgi:release factor glutamine methyltransferase